MKNIKILGYVLIVLLGIGSSLIASLNTVQEKTSDPSYILGSSSVDIPATNYSIPSGAIFMAPDGNDANSGTQNSPVRTISRAVSLSPSSGGTVVVRGGLYRDGRASNVAKSITFQAYPNEKPWFDGTDVVTGWTQDGDGKWFIAWDTPTFCSGKYNQFDGTNFDAGAGGPCHHPDQSLDPTNLMAWDPQMVYKNDNYIRQVSSRSEATGDTFFYDRTNKRVVLGFNPSGQLVELTARANALYIEAGSPSGGGVKGIGFKRFATNEYNGNRTHGALLVNVPGYLLENSVFTQNAGAGASFANPKNAVIRGNLFIENGFNGLDGNGKNALSGQTDDTLIENNTFRGNNTEKFGTGCLASCAAAGSKFAHMVGMTVKNNVFENNNGAGFWCDLYCTNVKIIGNIARNNTKSGLYYEVSNNGIIASNLAVNNGGEGIKSGSATTRIYNNTAVNNNVNYLLYDDSRAASGSEIAPDTVQVHFVNNLSYGGTNVVRVYNGQTTAPQQFNVFNRNGYHRPGGSPTRFIEWRTGGSPTPTYNSVTAFSSATGFDTQSIDSIATSDPFFVSVTGADYRVRSDSGAYRSGTDLPVDIAALLGTPATSPDLGALVYPGRGPAINPPAPAPTPPATPPSTPANPVITSFSASPTVVIQGNRTLLNWTVNNASSCSILSSGAAITPSGTSWQSPTLSSLGVRTYTLECRNSIDVTTSQTVSVTVVAASTKPGKPKLSSNKSTVKLSESFVLSWESTGATSCSLQPINVTATGAIGSKTISAIAATTAYSVTCSNDAGQSEATEVSVQLDSTQVVTEESLPEEERPVIVRNDSVVTNAAASETVTGSTTLDPTIVTDEAKQQQVERVEYYDGETLVYTSTTPPYTLDTTVLPNGTYTITARTYFKDGSTEEITRVLGVENTQLAPGADSGLLKNGNSGVVLLLLSLAAVAGIVTAGLFVYLKTHPFLYESLKRRFRKEL